MSGINPNDLSRYAQAAAGDGQSFPPQAMPQGNPKDLAGQSKPQLWLIPPVAEIEEALVMELGAKKYGPYNWRGKPIKLTVYVAAMKRHMAAMVDGQWLDPESGRPHLAHIRANTGILLDAAAGGWLIDDLPTPGMAASLLKELGATK